MFQASLRTKTGQLPRAQVAQSKTIVAPVKGWYVGAPLAAAPPMTAFLLQNAFPELDHVRVRAGSAQFATGMPSANVATLMAYRAGTIAATKMFASCNGSIFDVTNAGSVGAALVTGLNAAATFSYIQFAASGVQTLMAANGVDVIQLYNGTSWGTTPGITGLTGAPLNYLWAYKGNVWALQPNSLDAWFLPGSAIGGPISIYPMAPMFQRGGRLIAGGSWTVQSNSGPQYFIVFITDQGEVTIFTGDTPALAGWNRLGTYQISPPVGPKCLLQAGGDLAVMTQDGIVPISAVQSTDQVALQNQAVTLYIQPAWRDAVNERVGLTGWQIVSWPSKGMAIVTLPKSITGANVQFVANSRTGAWCEYTGWDVNSMEVGGFNLDKLFYGTSDGRVMQSETGAQDDGKAYTATIFPSFTGLERDEDQVTTRKQIRMVRQRLQSSGAISPQVTVRTDFDTTLPPAPSPSSMILGGAKWGVAHWGTSQWPRSSVRVQNWAPAQATGSYVSPVIQISLQGIPQPVIKLTAIDILFETGSILG